MEGRDKDHTARLADDFPGPIAHWPSPAHPNHRTHPSRASLPERGLRDGQVGGLLCLPKPLIRGTRIKVMFLTQTGPVLGSAEMLSPVSWTQQPFRFVALASGDQRRLQAITGCSPKLEMPIPEPTSRPLEGGMDWIDKYRAAISRTPP